MKSVVLKPNSEPGPRGFTLVELIVATAILVILTGLAVPLARVAIKREKERELRRALWELRDAIDRYQAAPDRGSLGELWQRERLVTVDYQFPRHIGLLSHAYDQIGSPACTTLVQCGH